MANINVIILRMNGVDVCGPAVLTRDSWRGCNGRLGPAFVLAKADECPQSMTTIVMRAVSECKCATNKTDKNNNSTWFNSHILVLCVCVSCVRTRSVTNKWVSNRRTSGMNLWWSLSRVVRCGAAANTSSVSAPNDGVVLWQGRGICTHRCQYQLGKHLGFY